MQEEDKPVVNFLVLLRFIVVDLFIGGDDAGTNNDEDVKEVDSLIAFEVAAKQMQTYINIDHKHKPYINNAYKYITTIMYCKIT